MKLLPVFLAAHGLPLLVLLLARAATAQPFDCDGVLQSPGEDVTLELVLSGLHDPVDATHAPGDTFRLFLAEQRGRILILDLASAALRATAFLDIRARVSDGGERGLLGLAFHPDYPTNRAFFVNYTRSGDGATVIARYLASPDDPNRALRTESVILVIAQPFANHNGGQLQFSPRDGYLYIGTGDGGSGGDPENNGQNPQSLLGKMLRIDVDSAVPYAIPPDNPFAGVTGVRGEIWALGTRNPWRFSFDPSTHDLYIGDVGQNTWEEIDYQPAESPGGENYEWRVREGDHTYSAGTAYGPGRRVAPLFEYRHSIDAIQGDSITAGVVYRGCRMPDLHGRYFFADYEDGWVRSLRIDGGLATDVRDHTAAFNEGVAGSVLSPVAFGNDGRGEVYLLDFQSGGTATEGRLYRIVPATPPNHPPTARITTDPSPAQVTLAAGTTQILLDGTSSDDGDGGTQELSYRWDKVAEASGDTIGRPAKETTLVTFTQSGDYTYRLTVSDGIASASADLIDANDSGEVDVSDAVHLFGYLFTARPPPPPPGALACGADPTDDDGLDCASYPPCA
jgi:glucose/arabinose dehydrogenase